MFPVQILRRGMEEVAALKEEAHDRIKIAKDIASQSQLKAKETIRAERSYSSARI